VGAGQRHASAVRPPQRCGLPRHGPSNAAARSRRARRSRARSTRASASAARRTPRPPSSATTATIRSGPTPSPSASARLPPRSTKPSRVASRRSCAGSSRRS
jgi:hypothetical protein